MNILDEVIGWISPRSAYERQAWRAGLAELNGARSYQAAERGRKTADWRASNQSGDLELIQDLPTLRARSRQMVRDNTYVAAALKNLVANLVGTGIEARAIHADPSVAALAQSIFADVARAPFDVEERHDFYGAQALSVRSMIEGGETLINWRPEGAEPDRRVLLMEGDHLDVAMTRAIEGGRIIAGVEYDNQGRRVAFHLSDAHPGDSFLRFASTPRRVPAADVDHLFEAVRISGQARGVPWFHAGLRKVRDVSEIEESVRIKKRIEACLAVFRKAGEGGTMSPLGEQAAQPAGPAWETLRPGMVINGRPGESIEVVNPNSVGDGDAFLLTQVNSIAASFGLPTHLMTGDVSRANYSSLRAAMVAFWALLDAWVYLTIVPQMCDPAFKRVMRREAIKRNDKRLLEVRAEWTPPKRSWVDPLKDITAEILEVRAFGGMPAAFAARGRDYRDALGEAAEVAALIDKLGLALDSDPRRISGVGALQPAAGYLRPTDPAAAGA